MPGVLGLAALLALAALPADASTVVSTGTVMVLVSEGGGLGEGAAQRDTSENRPCPAPPVADCYPNASNNVYTGIRYLPTNHDVFGPRAVSLWGFSYDTATASPEGIMCRSLSNCAAPGNPVVSLTGSGECGLPKAYCTVAACVESPAPKPVVRACRVYGLAESVAGADMPRLVQVDVTITNLRATPLAGLQYRESVPLGQDARAKPYNYLVSAGTGGAGTGGDLHWPGSYTTLGYTGVAPPASLRCSSDLWVTHYPAPHAKPGCLPPAVLPVTWPTGSTCDLPGPDKHYRLGPGSLSGGAPYSDFGPCVLHGAMFDVELGDLAPGATRTFRMWFGATPDEDAALADLAAVGARFYALSQHWDPAVLGDPAAGTPITGIWGWGPIDPPKPSLAWTTPAPGWTVPGWTPGTVCLGAAASFTGAATPDFAPVVESRWDFGDGTKHAESPGPGSPTHTYTAAGTYTVRLHVRDAAGATASVTERVTVMDCRVPPVASFHMAGGGADCVDNRVHFFGDASHDPDGGPVTWAWDFGDGATAAGNPVTHQFKDKRPVTVRLTVTDDEGRAATVTTPYPAPGDPNCVPDLDPLPELEASPGEVLTVALSARDADGPTLHILVAIGKEGATLAAVPGVFTASGTYTLPTAGWAPGTYTLMFQASDGMAYDAEPLVVRILGRESDSDRDGVQDAADNCPGIPNADQADADRDGRGDACHALPIAPAPAKAAGRLGPARDRDRDGVQDAADNCPDDANPAQADGDGDALGDACDPDRDGDGIRDLALPGGAFGDNCPTVPNPDQADRDGDGTGDACGPAAPAAAGLPPRGAGAAPAPPGPATGLAMALAAVGALLAAALRRRLWVGLVVLFSRLRGRDLLEHPARLRLLEAMEQDPGATTQQLADRCGLSRGSVKHHVALLDAAGLSWSQRAGKFTCHFARPAHAGAAERAAVLRSPLARGLAELAAASPGVRLPEAARRLGAGYKAAWHQARRLQQAGLLGPDVTAGLRPAGPPAAPAPPPPGPRPGGPAPDGAGGRPGRRSGQGVDPSQSAAASPA